MLKNDKLVKENEYLKHFKALASTYAAYILLVSAFPHRKRGNKSLIQLFIRWFDVTGFI